MNITHDQLNAIAFDADLTTDDIRTDYSGRGMYSGTCPGFDVDNERLIARLFVAAADVLGVDDAYDLADKLRTDSMGTGIIAYFPGVSVVDVEAEAAT